MTVRGLSLVALLSSVILFVLGPVGCTKSSPPDSSTSKTSVEVFAITKGEVPPATCKAAGDVEPMRSHYQPTEVTTLCEAAIKKGTKIYAQLYKEITGQDPLPGSQFPAGFGHLMGGYDAGYYGYLWSEVYAQDMFSLFPAEDLTNKQLGLRYRETILAQGNMKDPMELLKAFLGRDPNSDAFFKMLGF
ncbi:MAG: hypothetical protein JNM39_07845 [Bdellovibrionaceae bacterium]|nr:hypothetical protein [Pseudobdellovibrionaceae bacterium]